MSLPAVPVMQSGRAVPKHAPPVHVTGLQPGTIAAHVAAHCALAWLVAKLATAKPIQARTTTPRRAFIVSPMGKVEGIMPRPRRGVMRLNLRAAKRDFIIVSLLVITL